MGTGVGEAALAAEAIGAAEAAGAVAGGAGFLEGMAGVSALEGAGVAGLGLGTGAGLATGAGLGAGMAGGLGSLSPAFQTALGETAVFNPEIAAQTAQFANVGAVPPVGAEFGWNPADLATAGQGAGDIAAGQTNWQDIMAKGQQDALKARSLYPGTQLASAANTVSDAGSVVGSAATTPFSSAAEKAYAAYPDLGAGAPTGSLGANLPDVASTAAKTPGITDLLKTATQPLQDWWEDQNTLTKYGLGGMGAMQAAKYLNKQPGVATPEKYSGPLSKFSYNPSTYTPYTYKPYAAGGPVEEMSRENAIGANTGYPQSDIQQGAYATPWQTPVSRNVVANAGDVGVDQMTGMERMAEGGSTSSGDSGGAPAGNTGIAALGPMMYSPAMMSSSLVDPAAEYAAAQPMMDMSRQNFQNFLARYQNLPITEAAPEPVVYQGLYAGEGPKTAIAEPEWAGYSGASGGSVSPAGFGSGGGIANLGSYSDGGRLLKGPGDGMSDNIPATIGRKQPARLADGEFVVPADVVSGLGNGSTDAGAKQLYKMLDKVRSARTGNKKQGKQINPNKYMPA